MAKANLQEKKLEDLKKDLHAREEEIRKLRFNVAGTKGLKNNAGVLRKEIARIMTELRRRANQ